MELIHVKGNTYYLDGWSAIPLYIVEKGKCILIDSGWPFERADLEAALARHGLLPLALIATHVHTDHSGSLRYFQEKYKIPLVLSEGEAGIAFNDLTLKAYFYIFTLKEIKEREDLQAMHLKADRIIHPQDRELILEGIPFGIVHTPGHSPDQIAIETPDQVLCLGDALLSADVMNAAKLPYFFSIEDALQTMEELKSYSCTGLLAHKGITEDIAATAENNIARIHNRLDYFEHLIEGTMTLEDIIARACLDMKLLSKQLFKVQLYERDIRNYIDYLADHERIRQITENGRLYFTH